MSGFKSWDSYRVFAREVRSNRRYIRTTDQEEFLHEVLRTSEERIGGLKAGSSLWRAQLGHDWRCEYQDGKYIRSVADPFPSKRMKPIPGRAKEGRANPKGIPFLYLANRRDTAMSEVRPWIGSFVSCAHFKLTRDLKIVEFFPAGDYVFYTEEPDDQEKENAVWTAIDRAFSTPVTAEDDTADYVPTQVIAELFKSNGYDGIAYKSAFGKDDGYNIALFDPDNARPIHCAIHEVKSAAFEFEDTGVSYLVRDHRSD